MLRLIFAISLLVTASNSIAIDHPLYQVGKQDYILNNKPNNSLKDIRDQNKQTLIVFSADNCRPCLEFWPYFYTFQRMAGSHFNIAVVDITAGWGPEDQYESEGGFKVPSTPFIAILEPGKKNDPVIISQSEDARYFINLMDAERDPKTNEPLRNADGSYKNLFFTGPNIMQPLGIDADDFRAAYVKYYNEILVPDNRLYHQTIQSEINAGKTAEEAIKAGIKVVEDKY